MTFAVGRALCEKYDISVYQSADDRHEELEAAREEVHSDTNGSEATVTETADFLFPAASQ